MKPVHLIGAVVFVGCVSTRDATTPRPCDQLARDIKYAKDELQGYRSYLSSSEEKHPDDVTYFTAEAERTEQIMVKLQERYDLECAKK